VGLFRTKKV